MKRIYAVLLLGTILSSCEKETVPTIIETSNQSQNVIIPQNFDWENIDYMPAPAGNNILVPWAFGASRAFPEEFINDNRKRDGWELVYNTFNSNQLPSTDAYVIFYNRYRGLLRGYFYNRKNENPSTNIIHTLKISSLTNNSRMLDFVNEFVVVGQNTKTVSVIQPFQTGPQGTWHSAEFELAYDETTTAQQAAQYFLTWEVNNKAISQIIIDGVSHGTVNGTIAQATPGTNWGSILTKGALNIIGTSGAGLIGVATGELVASIKTGISDGVKGQVGNIVNGIFGGKADSSYSYVSLKTSTKYSFTGSSSSNTLLSSASLVLPGTIGQNNVSGYTALRNTPFGVFSLSSEPKVEVIGQLDNAEDWYAGDIPEDLDPRDPYYAYYMKWQPRYTRKFKLKLVENSFNIQFNPALINTSLEGAQIKNIRKDLIVPILYSKVNSTVTEIPTFINGESVKILENAIEYYTSEAVSPDGGGLPSTIGVVDNVYLRIAFDVVPNNGSKTTKIIKTFKVSLL